jgi:hypothetical protein
VSDWKKMESNSQTSSSGDPRVKISVSLEDVLDLMEAEVASFTNSAESRMNLNANGSFGKTSEDPSHPTEGKTSLKSFTDLVGIDQPSQGLDGRAVELQSVQSDQSLGGCWTLSSSESPNDAVESSLLQVLETWHDGLQEFSLSQKAAAGVLRRVRKVGKEGTLPYRLLSQLRAIAKED